MVRNSRKSLFPFEGKFKWPLVKRLFSPSLFPSVSSLVICLIHYVQSLHSLLHVKQVQVKHWQLQKEQKVKARKRIKWLAFSPLVTRSPIAGQRNNCQNKDTYSLCQSGHLILPLSCDSLVFVSVSHPLSQAQRTPITVRLIRFDGLEWVSFKLPHFSPYFSPCERPRSVSLGHGHIRSQNRQMCAPLSLSLSFHVSVIKCNLNQEEKRRKKSLGAWARSAPRPSSLRVCVLDMDRCLNNETCTLVVHCVCPCHTTTAAAGSYWILFAFFACVRWKWERVNSLGHSFIYFLFIPLLCSLPTHF